MDSRFLIGAAAVLGALAAGGKGRSRGGSSVQKRGPQATLLNPADSLAALGIPKGDWPQMTFDIPFAAGSPFPVWPIVTKHEKKFVISYKSVEGSIFGNSSRRFMAQRDSKYHSGVDLYGNDGDPIVAAESGTVSNYYHFYHGTYALFIQCDSGLVINYGEVKRDSWKEFGLSRGSRVKKGQPIARVGLMSGGSHMCHFETYMPPTEQNKKYYGGNPGPLLNPTYYLLLAMTKSIGGRVYAGTDCLTYGTRNKPIPQDLKWIEKEDKRVGDPADDSVLTELLDDGSPNDGPDMAFGP